jgi:signal transduction histidine kinase
MKCPKCQTENPGTRKFCKECGAKLIQGSRPSRKGQSNLRPNRGRDRSTRSPEPSGSRRHKRGRDYALEQKAERYGKLLQVGQIITSEMNLEALFPLIIQHTNGIMDTQTSSIFLYDRKPNELWSLVSTDLKKNEIRIPATYGIAGWVFQNRAPTIVNDTSSDPRFDADVDEKTGFRTRNILCVPLINRQKECVGTLQALNKNGGDFRQDDIEMLTSLSDYATIALENSMLYEELKSMNKAKERAIDHLSHELATPLALISATLSKISSRLNQAKITGLERSVIIAQKNLHRLIRLQEEIDNIIRERSAEDRTKITKIIENGLHFIEYQNGVGRGKFGKVLDLLSDYLDSIYKVSDENTQKLLIEDFLQSVCDDARRAMGKREVEIVQDFVKGRTIIANRSALEKVCSGILRNAVENTPDQGRIEVTAKTEGDQMVIRFRDFGTGITAENQKLVFAGFFHTQDTDHYSTKAPYDFNAGGSGADLLRAKVFSERYGFEIDFESTRCSHIPEDIDECPGRISLCQFIGNRSDCFASGTIFSLRIPLKRGAEDVFLIEPVKK